MSLTNNGLACSASEVVTVLLISSRSQKSSVWMYVNMTEPCMRGSWGAQVFAQGTSMSVLSGKQQQEV